MYSSLYISGRGFESRSKNGRVSSFCCVMLSYVDRGLAVTDPLYKESYRNV
jgi:hypothetical protein